MNRAARRRARKQESKQEALAKEGQWLRLENPVANQFAAFVVGNAPHCDHVVTKDSALGQHLVICGAGPSLAETAAEWCPQGDQVWGCNSAMIWLHEQGHKVTHGFTVDQTPHMVAEWMSTPEVGYLCASSIHPHLTDLLVSRGRHIDWFHNFVGIQRPPVYFGRCDDCRAVLDKGGGLTDLSGLGVEQVYDPACAHTNVSWQLIPYEDWLYLMLYNGTVRAGWGLNSVTRAIEVGLYMGFDKITVLGADCCLRAKRELDKSIRPGSPEHMRWLREDVVMHADGGSALASGATPVTLEAEIDGRIFHTKPDMAISAVWLVIIKRHFGDRIQLIGDGLPNALKDKPQEFLSRLPTLVDSEGRPMEIVIGDAHL